MKHRFPRRFELALLIAVCIVCALIVRATGKYDVGLALVGAPLFLVSALMGLRRSNRARATVPATPQFEVGRAAASDGVAE